MELTQSGSSACAQFCCAYHKYGHEVGSRLHSSSVSYVKVVPKTVTFFLSLMLFNRLSSVPCLKVCILQVAGCLRESPYWRSKYSAVGTQPWSCERASRPFSNVEC